MKHVAIWLALLCGVVWLGVAQPALAQDEFDEGAPAAEAEDEGQKLPKTFDEFVEQHKELGKTPQGASKSFLDSLFVYMNPDTREEGRKMIHFIVIEYKTGDRPFEQRANSQILAERLRDPDMAYIFHSYVKGTSPENQYKFDLNNYEVNIEKSNEGGPYGYQCWWRSTGADSARAISFKKSNQSGLWYVADWTGLPSMVRKPIDPDVETFE